MTTVLLTSPAGKAEGALALPASIFDVEPNISVMHQVVVAQQAAMRQGTHSTKTRGAVSGGGKKPYRQKGTGRARQGSIRAPQFVGGGVVHGPTPHGYAQRTPKKMTAAALRGALTDRARGGCVHVLSSVVDGDSPSTKGAVAALVALGTGRTVLAVIGRDEATAAKSLRNIPGVDVIAANQLSAYAVLRSDDVVFTRTALDSFLEFCGADPAADGNPSDAAAKEGAADGPAAAAKPASQKGAARTTAPPTAAKTADTDDEPQSAAAAPAAKETSGADLGPGSHAPLEDGAEPDGFPVKGKISSKLYHVPGSSHYSRTVAEVWFDTAASAEAAGFQLPSSQRKAAAEADTNEEGSN